jgi:hypothetical protein
MGKIFLFFTVLCAVFLKFFLYKSAKVTKVLTLNVSFLIVTLFTIVLENFFMRRHRGHKDFDSKCDILLAILCANFF